MRDWGWDAMSAATGFMQYRAGELAADRIIHVMGTPSGRSRLGHSGGHRRSDCCNTHSSSGWTCARRISGSETPLFQEILRHPHAGAGPRTGVGAGVDCDRQRTGKGRGSENVGLLRKSRSTFPIVGLLAKTARGRHSAAGL
jgi:hypothetical protein